MYKFFLKNIICVLKYFKDNLRKNSHSTTVMTTKLQCIIFTILSGISIHVRFFVENYIMYIVFSMFSYYYCMNELNIFYFSSRRNVWVPTRYIDKWNLFRDYIKKISIILIRKKYTSIENICLNNWMNSYA